MKKKIISIGLVLIMIFCFPMSTFAESTESSTHSDCISITINGKAVVFTDDLGYPFVDSAYRTQVPLRVTMEACGYSVFWDSVNKSASITDGTNTVHVPIGQKYIKKNQAELSTDTEALAINGRIYLPINPVLTAFGKTVTWNAATNTVEVTDGNGTTGSSSASSGNDSVSDNTSSDPAFYVINRTEIHTANCYKDSTDVAGYGYIVQATGSSIAEILSQIPAADSCRCVLEKNVCCNSYYYLGTTDEMHSRACYENMVKKGTLPASSFYDLKNTTTDSILWRRWGVTVCDCVTKGRLCS